MKIGPDLLHLDSLLGQHKIYAALCFRMLGHYLNILSRLDLRPLHHHLPSIIKLIWSTIILRLGLSAY